jgi:hypothetical protein
MDPEIQGEMLGSPAEELSHVRKEVLKRENVLMSEGRRVERDAVISETVHKHGRDEQVILDPSYRLPQESIHSLALNLSPETHDKKMDELLMLLHAKGIKNTLSIIEKIGDVHIEDDFHRFLVQYIKKGFEVKDLKERTPLSKALNMTLYEVVLPENIEGKDKGLKDVLSGMEQFYAGMLSVSPHENPGENHIALEIANSNGSDEFVFYVSVPNSKRSLFEKQILSIFHDAKIIEKNDDHNIFNESGTSLGSLATYQASPIFPIKTYESFEHDPLNVVLNSFSKIDKDGEGACLQVLMCPAGDYYTKKFKKALEDIKKGKDIKEATDFSSGFFNDIGRTLGEAFGSSSKKEKGEESRPVDQSVLEAIEKKISRPIVNVTVRLVASAASESRSESILSDLESGFNQFENTKGNSIKWKRVKGSSLKAFLRSFAFRSFDKSESMPLNFEELTSIIHFHTSALKGASQLKTARSGDAPPPMDLSTEGTLLGINHHRNTETRVFITDEDRLRHIYTIGQTGTGKTTLLKNMIIQDIERGNGVCMIDPHGSDILDVLAHIPAERRDDVIYFDPSYTPRPMGLNMLEYDRSRPEQKTFVVNELFSIFQKLYGGVPESMGPMFEQYFRNATMLVIEDPDTGCTLLDVSRVMSNKEFRQMKLSRCKNPIVVQFWTEVAEKAGGEASLANIVPYITSKFDVFLANDIMRPIVAQEKSAFNFRQIMDEKKILLVNLSKGRLGDINANLIGLILVGKILMAALSRVDTLSGSSQVSVPAFYLYIDEFQNITTNSISTILSEARKYKLSLFLAHQFIAQLTEDIKNSVFGNVGNMAVYRVGADDAEYLAKQFEPVFTAPQIMNIDNFNAYIKMLVRGKPAKPFNIRAMQPRAAGGVDINSLQELSYLKYGRNRNEVDEETLAKYKKA